MNLIVSEVYDAFIDAGASEEKAKAAAGAIPLAERLATKEDLDELKKAIDDRFSKIDDRFSKIDDRFSKIERDMAVLKFGYGPLIIGLLVKVAFFSS